MEYVRLGKSGLKISKVIMGGMSWGSDKWQGWVMNEDKALPLLEYAWKKGINTWDTADIYSMGRSEEIIRKAMETYHIPRDDLVILTKCYFGVTPDRMDTPMAELTVNGGRLVNKVGLSRKHIFDAVEASVKRLGTYIDVLQIHRLDRDTDRVEIMKALNDVVEKGWVRYLGASSMHAWEFQTLQNIAKNRGWHEFISMQNYYNLIYREEEREMHPYCHDVGVGLIPWSPIARGILSRPWRDTSSTRAETDPWIEALMSYEDEVDEKVVGVVEQVAKEKGVSMAAIATAWCLHKGVNPIVGISSKERVDQTIEATKVKLTEEEVKRLEEHYQPKNVKPVW